MARLKVLTILDTNYPDARISFSQDAKERDIGMVRMTLKNPKGLHLEIMLHSAEVAFTLVELDGWARRPRPASNSDDADRARGEERSGTVIHLHR